VELRIQEFQLARTVVFQVDLLLVLNPFLETLRDVHLREGLFLELLVKVVGPNKDSILLQGLLGLHIVAQLLGVAREEDRLEVGVSKLYFLAVLLKLVLFLEKVALHQNVRIAGEAGH